MGGRKLDFGFHDCFPFRPCFERGFLKRAGTHPSFYQMPKCPQTPRQGNMMYRIPNLFCWFGGSRRDLLVFFFRSGPKGLSHWFRGRLSPTGQPCYRSPLHPPPPSTPPTQLASFNVPRSPSSALSHPFLGEGSPTKIDYKKKVPVFQPLHWRT